MVTGYNGVKGPKADPTIAGTAIQYLAVNSTLPTLVIKDARTRAQKPVGLYRYGVCYDGSPQAKKALETAIKMMRANDRLTTITVREPMVDDSKTDEMVKQMMRDAGVTGEYDHVSLEHSKTETVYNTIKNYLKSQVYGTNDYVDWICLGNCGKGYEINKQKLGSLANACLRGKRMNVLFVPQ